MNIVCCFDHNYIMPQGVMMQSLCVNNKEEKITFHLIIDGSVTQRDKNDLCAITAQFPDKTVEYYVIDKLFIDSNPHLKGRYLSQAMYYRLYLSEILPKSINKVLYLDCDMIVCHSLRTLWDIDVSHVALAGIPDVLSGEEIERLGYPSELNYFNAGVLLINLDYWRDNDVLSEFLAYITKQGSNLYYHDQDVLNYVFREKKVLLPIKFNFISSFLFTHRQAKRDMYSQQVKEAIQDPVVIHYVVGTKPWQRTPSTPRIEHPFAGRYQFYQDQTKWKGVYNDLRPIRIRIRQYLGDVARMFGLIKKKPIYTLISTISAPNPYAIVS